MTDYIDFRIDRKPIGPLVRVPQQKVFSGGDRVKLFGREYVVTGYDSAARALTRVDVGGGRAADVLVRVVTIAPVERKDPRCVSANVKFEHPPKVSEQLQGNARRPQVDEGPRRGQAVCG